MEAAYFAGSVRSLGLGMPSDFQKSAAYAADGSRESGSTGVDDWNKKANCKKTLVLN